MADITIGDELRKVLDEYSKDLKSAANNAIDSVAKESVKKLKATSPKRPKGGRYARGWGLQRERTPLGVNLVTVHNKTDWQLTYLLENGHVTRNKYGEYGRTPAHPHIKAVEEWVQSELPIEIEKELKNI